MDYLITFRLSAFFYSERTERALAFAQWNLLTVKAEAIRDSWSMKGAFHWLVPAVTRDFCPALAALVSHVENIFSSPETISLHLSPSHSKMGRQSCRVACLLISVSGSTPGYLSVERVSVHHDGGEVLGPGELGNPLLQVSYTHLQERTKLATFAGVILTASEECAICTLYKLLHIRKT
jgi:hypothetical protein